MLKYNKCTWAKEKQHLDLIISVSWRHLQRDKKTRLRMVSRSKGVFQIQNIRLMLLRRLSIYQQQERSCFSWLHRTAPLGGTGVDHQRFSATMLRQHSKTKAQSCSGDALLLCFNVAAGRPAAPLTCSLVLLKQHRHWRPATCEKCSVLHPDWDQDPEVAFAFYIN